MHGDFTADGSKLELSNIYSATQLRSHWAAQTCSWSICQTGQCRLLQACSTHFRTKGEALVSMAFLRGAWGSCVGRGRPVLEGDAAQAFSAAPPRAAATHLPLGSPPAVYCGSGKGLFLPPGSPGTRSFHRLLKEEGVEQDFSLRQSW